MNLARVEYYFSEFLSRLEARPRFSDAVMERKRADAMIPIDIRGMKLPVSLFPSHNVLFAGTMNDDESTQALSDKVLDPPARCGDNFPKLIRGGWQHAPPLTGCSLRHPHTGTERQIDHIFLSASLICKSVKYSWDFERLALNGTRGKVGHPDHAMLICEFDQA